MPTNRAIVVDPTAPDRLTLRPVEEPAPHYDQAVVRVAAISLNRGEIRRSASAAAGWRPGWDLAGVVERAAPSGTGPAVGTRVVGLLAEGAWAERVAIQTSYLAPLPESISFAQAATFPVAGLTALHAVERGGSPVGRSILVTGASGGVGHFACQIAVAGGARVVGLLRTEHFAEFVGETGAEPVVSREGALAAAEHGPYDLVIESVGGRTLHEALTLLAPNGTCVSFGQSAGSEATIDVGRFYGTGGLTLFGLILFHELRREPAAIGLARLIRLVEAGKVRPRVEIEAPWENIASVARRLMERSFAGKAVLHVSP